MNPKDQAASSRVPLQLLPAITAIEGAKACKEGAEKYGPYNWRDEPITLMKYIGALERHIARLKDGEDLDSKSGNHHLGHIIATAGIVLDADACGTLIDDRPTVPGKASEMFDAFEDEQNRSKK